LRDKIVGVFVRFSCILSINFIGNHSSHLNYGYHRLTKYWLAITNKGLVASQLTLPNKLNPYQFSPAFIVKQEFRLMSDVFCLYKELYADLWGLLCSLGSGLNNIR
jgi:hypothetical protein